MSAPDNANLAVNSVEYWTKELAAARKWFHKFHTSARKAEKAFLGQDDRNDPNNATGSKFNLFWSNIQTVASAAYNRIPKVSVDRTHLDASDDVGRVAGIILERIFQFEDNSSEEAPHYTYQECIQDRLVPGLGMAWARYDFTESNVTMQGQSVPIITAEQAPLDYVRWDDILFSPCRRWSEKRWVGRRHAMTRESMTKRFGEAIATAVPYNYKGAVKSPDPEDPMRYTAENCAEVWEFWEITTRSAYWFCPGHASLLDAKQDPLQLRTFWPCKRPLLATVTTRSLLPKPDYEFAKSQYEELNTVASRCALLTDAIKVVGVYDKNNDDVKRLLNQAGINQMIPVDNWAMFAERGGMKGVVDWFPLEMVIKTLMELTKRKAELVQEVYELMGISDIQRGTASTRETATTQRLKAQFGSARSNKPAEEIARFITDCSRLRAEIICKHWQPETILQRSQIEHTPDKEHAMAAVALLKSGNDVISRITVSADTFSAPDWDMEKQQRIDFLQAISQFLGMSEPLVMRSPGAAPFVVEIMQWAATGFKGAKQIEGVLDRALDALKKDAMMPKAPPPPTPEDLAKLAGAIKTMADARNITVEAITKLLEAGLNPQVLAAIPPQGQFPPNPGAAVGGGGPGGAAPIQAPPGGGPRRMPPPRPV